MVLLSRGVLGCGLMELRGSKREQKLTSLSERTPSSWSLLTINEPHVIFSTYTLASLLMFMTPLSCCCVNCAVGPCPAVNTHQVTEVSLVATPQWRYFSETCILWVITCRSLFWSSIFGSSHNWHWWSKWHWILPQPAPISPSANTLYFPQHRLFRSLHDTILENPLFLAITSPTLFCHIWFIWPAQDNFLKQMNAPLPSRPHR